MHSQALFVLISRLLMASIFLWAGWGKLGGYEGTVGRIAASGLPVPDLLTIGAIAIELIGGALLIVGWHTRWAALALAVFCVFTAVSFHAFWGVAPEQVIGQKIHFLKNFAMAGGLLLLWTHGGGALSLISDHPNEAE